MELERRKGDSHNISAIAIVTALSMTGDSMLYIVLPIYWKSAGLDSIWQVGILLAANRLIRLPLNPFVGWYYQRASLRKGLVAAVVLSSVTTCGYGLAKGFIAWLILRCAWGCAWSLLRIGGLSAVTRFSEDSRLGKTMGTYNGLYRLGSLMGMLIGGALVPIGGIQAVSLALGLISLIGLPLIFHSIPKKDIGQWKTENRSFRFQEFPVGLFSRNIIIVIGSGFFISMLFQGLFVSSLSAAILFHYGNDVHLLGTVVSASALSGFIQAARWTWEPFLASLFGAWSDGTHGRMPLYITSLCVAAVIFGVLTLPSPVWYWIVFIIIVMLSATALTTLTDALASDVSKSKPDHMIVFLTIYSIAVDLGAALGPLIAYLLISVNDGFQYMYLGGSGLFFAIAALWYFERKLFS